MATENQGNAILRERKGDRRINRQLSGPPYQTAEGIITVDRRTHLDRRANWISDFAFAPEAKSRLSVVALIARLEELLRTHGDIPVTLRDADTQWLFPLEARHVKVMPGAEESLRLEIAVAYGDPMEMSGRGI
ncbi:MAG: hypothetical protein H6R13_3164 [Proteobacteria bacterium]|nr:hypothetical protein [Pseudomonadota bacterium]